MSNIKTIASYFDNLAAHWPEDEKDACIRDRIIQRACLTPGNSILDIGCGKGVMVPHLLKTAPKEIIELDVSKEMIRLGRERFSLPQITHICGDIFTVPLPSIDAAVVFNAYPHLMDKQALAKRLHRLLNDQGIVIIAHSKGKEFINAIHHDDGLCEEISIPLKTPLKEFEIFSSFFSLEDWQDASDLYYMKLKKNNNTL